uniref:S-adenosylmethionine-dependent methyltransferase n=1 Tax=Hypericum tomentosum TaxID=1137039 RepID=A0A224X4D8_9ROSI
MQAPNGGESKFSYKQNSFIPREATKSVIWAVEEAIAESLDVKSLLSSTTTFRIADLGCSIGPNTFDHVETVINAVKLKLQSQALASKTLDFQVFFNDLPSNDFNTLFRSLPHAGGRGYYACGIPDSFYCRLFPNSSLHFAHCLHAVQYLSRVPPELLDKASPAFNRGRVSYVNAPRAVEDAYVRQFDEDLETFLGFRAQEIVVGGMIVVLVKVAPSGVSHSATPHGFFHVLMNSALEDMVKDGLVSQDKVDLCNIPAYAGTPEQWRGALERSKSFKIEKFVVSSIEQSVAPLPMNPQIIVFHFRAVLEGILAVYFDQEVIDELFDRLLEKASRASMGIQASGAGAYQLFIALKRV